MGQDDSSDLATGRSPQIGSTKGSAIEEARDRMKTLTREELEKKGITKDMAEKWRDFYQQEAARNPNNPSATGRAELMQRAVDLLDGKE